MRPVEVYTVLCSGSFSTVNMHVVQLFKHYFDSIAVNGFKTGFRHSMIFTAHVDIVMHGQCVGRVFIAC